MKKIILSLAVIAIVAIGVIGATRAYFSDVKTSNDNNFASGTLELTLDGTNTNAVKFSVANTAPGASGTGYWALKNIGSMAGYLDLENKTITNDDNGCNTAESAVDSTCTPLGGGELGANMNVLLFLDVDKDGVKDAEDTQLYSGTLDGLASATVADISFPAGSEQFISMNWSIPVTVGNIIQSDITKLNMTFELGQTAEQIQ